MTIEEKEYYLTKVNYSAKDVMAILGIHKTQATKVIKECKIKFGGAVLGRTNFIKAESFWKREGTTIEEELRKLGCAKGYVKN